MYQIELEDLKKSLPKKGLSLVAREAGVSVSLVSMVFKGERDSEKVIKAALKVIAAEKNKKEKLLKEIKKAI